MEATTTDTDRIHCVHPECTCHGAEHPTQEQPVDPAELGQAILDLFADGATYITLSTTAGDTAYVSASRFTPNPAHNPDDPDSRALISEWDHCRTGLVSGARQIHAKRQAVEAEAEAVIA